ncbi:MAG: FAD-dependent oxidoreductase [Verrucomicrobia bacterium]|nr:FAD-dependent oxidoreductase [Verrucomicrobiota bacterium]
MIRNTLGLLVCLTVLPLRAGSLLVEAEAFGDPGGWKVDTQFMLQMGSPYLLAHGLGTPVADATTTVALPETGTYRIFVRTKDWVAPWAAEGAPGKFQLLVNGTPLRETFGTKGAEWHWHDGGVLPVIDTKVTLSLHDLTGFDGRCDAILFTTNLNAQPPDGGEELVKLRRELLNLPETVTTEGPYDLVVIGGGYSGLGASISAARQGLKVALIQDREVLGGNGSSEVRVWAQGNIRLGKYPHIGDIIEEFTDRAPDSPGTAADFVDGKKAAVVAGEKTLDLFLGHFAHGVEMKDGRIAAVVALDVRKSIERRFEGTLFCDATGHGTIGGLAGADFDMTVEGHMGTSNMWSWEQGRSPQAWPETPWALELTTEQFPETRASKGPGSKFFKGEWFWESGFDHHPLDDLELIRDWNLRAVFGAFSAIKAEKGNENARLQWLAYIGGTRESRRLLGDVILTEEDVVNKRDFPDGCVPTTWSIDLHYPKKEFLKGFEDNPFISVAVHGKGVDRSVGYPVPYRCFYSRNIPNLFMAGRCVSVTHEVLGTVRVMRTCGMMGEVVGKAAWIATTRKTTPRGVYENYLPPLIALLQQPGALRRDSPDGTLYLPANAAQPSAIDRGLPSDSLAGIVVDDQAARLKGKWSHGDGLKPTVNNSYAYAGAGDGVSATFPIRVKKSGRYEVRYYLRPHENRCKTATLTIAHGKGSSEVPVDLSKEPSAKNYQVVGSYDFVDVLPASVTITGPTGSGFLHADCVQLVPVK